VTPICDITLRLGTTLTCAVSLLVGGTALAQPPIDSVSISPDVDVGLAGTFAADEDVAVDNLLGVVLPASLGSIPKNAAVKAYHLLANGEQLFALDTTAYLPGPLLVEQRDIVRYDGAAYTLEFDGSTAGVPNGVAVDAVSMTDSGQLLLSFETTAQLGGVVAADEDVVGWNGASFFMALDLSAEGVSEALDTDAIHDLQDGRGAFSFDGSGVVGGVPFDDEDVLMLDVGASTWTLEYDGSAQHAALAAADVEAVALPEPGQLLMLASGITFLLGLGRRRMRSQAAAEPRSRARGGRGRHWTASATAPRPYTAPLSRRSTLQ
jgi:hypothetical protein